MYLWLADLKDGQKSNSLKFGDMPTSSFFVLFFDSLSCKLGWFPNFFFQKSCSLFTPFFTLFFFCLGGKDEQNTIFYEQTSFSNQVEGKETPPTTIDNLRFFFVGSPNFLEEV